MVVPLLEQDTAVHKVLIAFVWVFVWGLADDSVSTTVSLGLSLLSILLCLTRPRSIAIRNECAQKPGHSFAQVALDYAY